MGKKQTPDEFTGAWRTGEKKKMKKDAKVLTVQDISCFGQCSLTVALPVISAAGIECAVLPSAVLSTHTGGFKGFTFRDLTDDIPGIVSHWEKEGITFKPNGCVNMPKHLWDTTGSLTSTIGISPTSTTWQ